MVSSTKNVDVLVVLGNRVYENGHMSPVLNARVARALDVYNAGKTEKIFVSGGLGKEGHYEAQVMAKYLIDNGVPSSDIIIDDYGNSTRETLVNFSKYYSSNMQPGACVGITTSYYHMLRSGIIFEQSGFSCVRGYGARYVAFQDLYKIVREMVAIPVYIVGIK